MAVSGLWCRYGEAWSEAIPAGGLQTCSAATRNARSEGEVNAHQLRKQLRRLKGECTWCGAKVPVPRRTWCSQTCVDEFRREHDWVWIRSRVHERDHGVCEICGFDSDKMSRIKKHLHRDGGWVGSDYLRKWLWRIGFHSGGHLWEADHIQPRVLGGMNSMDNLRTLCLPCHERVTTELAASRAADRHDANRPLLTPSPPV